MKYGKKYADSLKAYDRSKLYDANEALGLVVETAKAKFDETIELHVRPPGGSAGPRRACSPERHGQNQEGTRNRQRRARGYRSAGRR